MKLTLALLALAATALAGPSALAQSKPDFTGTWKLNIEKSDLGGRPITELVVKIDHKEPAFTYTASGVADGNSFEQTEKITTDNKPAQDENGNTSTGHWDGSVLVFETKSPDGTVIQTAHISLSADGKTAVRDGTNKTPDGDKKLHEIYEKQ